MILRDITPPPSLISGLPDGYITTSFSKLEYLCELAEEISESTKTEEVTSGSLFPVFQHT
jgi:hypothetical protein